MTYKEWIWTLLFVAFIMLLGSWLFKSAPKVIAPVEAAVTWQEELKKDTILYALAKCESNLNPLALNPADTNGLPSRGLLQFQSETWILWTSQIDKARGWNIWNPEHQVEVGTWALKKGLIHHWPTCSRQI